MTHNTSEILNYSLNSFFVCTVETMPISLNSLLLLLFWKNFLWVFISHICSSCSNSMNIFVRRLQYRHMLLYSVVVYFTNFMIEYIYGAQRSKTYFYFLKTKWVYALKADMIAMSKWMEWPQCSLCCHDAQFRMIDWMIVAVACFHVDRVSENCYCWNVATNSPIGNVTNARVQL